jgi:hypothetical protein
MGTGRFPGISGAWAARSPEVGHISCKQPFYAGRAAFRRVTSRVRAPLAVQNELSSGGTRRRNRPNKRAQHPLMIGTQHTASPFWGINLARIVFAGAIVGSCAVGLAVRANASPCDPLGLSMTPQPQLSCTSPDSAPPADGTPAPGPVNNAAGPPPPGAPPAPGQPPYVPPVVNPDGTQSYGQLGFLRQVWHEFHNGVPSELLYGPDPDQGPPGSPIPPSPPAAPVPPPPQ